MMPHSLAERSPIPERDQTWPISPNVTVFIGLQLAFWLGVVITMFTYQVGFLQAVR
jgi:hypothetical protein